MNKKRFVISLLFSITILFVISSSTALADHTLDPTPDQLHKSSEFKGLMGNVKYIYMTEILYLRVILNLSIVYWHTI